MNIQDRIALHRLKRTREIESRLRCHGNKESHTRAHQARKVEYVDKPYVPTPGNVKIKQTWSDWFKKILIRLKNLITFSSKEKSVA